METTIKESASLTGLARQQAYLQELKQSGNSNDSFFITDKVMESMRDSGYRDIRKAINDLIDNSEQAGAKKIAVVTTTSRDNQKNAKEKISNIAVVDDGYGMYPEMLEVAVKWGGTDRHDQRDGLGRFGFGLPTASISVTRVYEVYSKVKEGEWHKVRVDLNSIAETALSSGGNISYTPKCEQTTLPDFVKTYLKKQWKKDDLEQGTIVLLLNPDRIRRFSLPQIFQAKMLQNIGITYRHFMPNVSFFVNETKVEMIDPLFLNPNCIGYDAGNNLLAESIEEMPIRVKNTLRSGKTIEGDIILRFSVMNPKFQRTKDGELIKNRFNIMKENNGYFVVCRAGRQIDIVREPYYQSDEEDNITIVNYDANWVIELDFDPILDELFGITTNKQQVEIDAYLWDVFKANNLPAIVKSIRSKLSKLRTEEDVQEEKKQENRASEQIMSEAEKFDKLDLPEDKKEAADKKFHDDAQTTADERNESLEDILEEMKNDADRSKYKIEFTSLPGAPFYDIEIWGSQIKIKLNTAHRFYSDIYSQQDVRGKTALELLLFVIGKCEVESTGDKLLFYGNERFDWSRKLDLRLRMLDKKDPIIDKESFVAESK